MTALYIDSSAFAARFLPSQDAHRATNELMDRFEHWCTSSLTVVEAARAIAINTSPDEWIPTIGALDVDLDESLVVGIDDVVLAMAREIALETGAKSLDAIHIATALRLDDADVRFLTLDRQQRRAAGQVGLPLAT